MNFHIIGACGYIGTKLLNYLPKQDSPICYDMVDGEGILPINLEKPESFDFSKIKAGDFVLFLAAISRPDLCKNQREMAYRINVEGTGRFIQAFVDRGANVLFFSSDVVYGETDFHKVNELSHCNPFGPYAEMKHAIELKFEGNSHVKVFRLSYVFSREDRFTSYLAECAKAHKTAEVFDTLYRSVIYINDIFDAIIALSKNFNGFDNQVFNLSGNEVLSRKDIAELYKRVVDDGLDYCTVEPPEGFFDARPPIIATESLYLEKLLGRKPTMIKEALINEYHR